MSPRLLLLVGASCFACATPQTSVGVAAVPLALDGGFGASAGAATIQSTVEDLGLDDEELGVHPRLDLDWEDTHLSIGWLGAGFAGSGTTTDDVTIDGVTINAGTPVDTRADLAAITGVFTWDVVPVGPGDLGIGLGVTLLDIDLEMVSQLDSTRLASDEILPLPVLTARLDLHRAPVAFGASVGGIDVSFDEGAAQVLDIDAFARVQLADGIGGGLSANLIGGYRSFSADGHYDDGATRVEADVRLAGPYLGLSLSF
jgi:hypothetical protein